MTVLWNENKCNLREQKKKKIIQTYRIQNISVKASQRKFILFLEYLRLSLTYLE